MSGFRRLTVIAGIRANLFIWTFNNFIFTATEIILKTSFKTGVFSRTCFFGHN